MTLAIGSVVGGRYTLVRPLDRGGMGTVWEAREASGGVLAIKFLSYSVAHPAALKRFRREAKALERLNHPNVVRMVAHGLEDNLPFIAMERLQGQTLRRLLQGGALPPRVALGILRGAACGLRAAHALRMVHRDVKPSNLFLCGDTDFVTKVIDFGIATGDPLDADGQASTTGLIGSPAYMSPEQARGEQLDHSADIWSLTVVAFQMFTGREPFGGANVPETLQRICSGRVPRASEVAMGLPAGIDRVFQRAFAAKRGERISDLEELVAALEAACESAPNVAATSLGTAKPVARFDTTASFASSLGERRSSSSRVWRYTAAGLVPGAVVSVWLALNLGHQRAATGDATSSEQHLQSIVASAAQVPSPPKSTASEGKAQTLPASSGSNGAPTTNVAKAIRLSIRPVSKPMIEKREPAAPPSVSLPPVASASAPELDPVFGLPVSGRAGRSDGSTPRVFDHVDETRQ
jgi:serine/threonine protein kinase